MPPEAHACYFDVDLKAALSHARCAVTSDRVSTRGRNKSHDL